MGDDRIIVLVKREFHAFLDPVDTLQRISPVLRDEADAVAFVDANPEWRNSWVCRIKPGGDVKHLLSVLDDLAVEMRAVADALDSGAVTAAEAAARLRAAAT